MPAAIRQLIVSAFGGQDIEKLFLGPGMGLIYLVLVAQTLEFDLSLRFSTSYSSDISARFGQS